MLTTIYRTVPPLLLALLVTACATPGQGAKPPEPAASAPAPVEPPPQPEPPPPPTPAMQAQAQKTAMASVDLLEAGQEDQARAELQRALSLDPGNKLANNLMRQITGDPVAMYGRDSFAYVVRPNDTLSRIAGRFMGDIYGFYGLARYNDIRVPRQVAGGQTLRIPGKAPPPGSLDPVPPRKATRPDPAAAVTPPPAPAATTTAPAPAAPPPPPPPPELTPGEKTIRNAEAHEKAGRLERAFEEYRRAEGMDQPDAAAKAESVRKRLIVKHTLTARTAFAKQDLAGAIRGWDQVLQLDPGNDVAKLERQKAVTLKQKADQLK